MTGERAGAYREAIPASDVVLAVAQGLLWAIDPSSGDTLWQSQICEAARAVHVTVDDQLVIVTDGVEVSALELATGDLVWCTAVFGVPALEAPHVSLLVRAERVLVGGAGRLVCLDRETGAIAFDHRLASGGRVTVGSGQVR